MKYGVREICNVVFKAKSNVKIGNTTFQIGQPVLYIDSAKTSTMEGAATSVYATGGRGNTRLVVWEGEKTLTFTVEDALISPVGLSVLTGAGLIKGLETEFVHVRHSVMAYADSSTGEIDLTDALGETEKICADAPLFIMEVVSDSLTGKIYTGTVDDVSGKKITSTDAKGKTVMIDFYIQKESSKVSEIQIDAAHFAGYFYMEADTLFRRQVDGVDAVVNITMPNVKIQSNFNFTMASSGDPSTFTFTMDALPGYTYFDKTKKVLCVMQIVEEGGASASDTFKTVMPHTTGEVVDIDMNAVDDNIATGDAAVKDSTIKSV